MRPIDKVAKNCSFCCTAAAAAAKSLQSYPTLCDPIDGSPPGSAIPGICQAITLEWVAISFNKAKLKISSCIFSKMFDSQDFPSGPVAKIPYVPYKGTRVQSLIRERDSTCYN